MGGVSCSSQVAMAWVSLFVIIFLLDLEIKDTQGKHV